MLQLVKDFLNEDKKVVNAGIEGLRRHIKSPSENRLKLNHRENSAAEVYIDQRNKKSVTAADNFGDLTSDTFSM